MSPDAALRVIRADNPSPMTLDGTRTYIVGRARPVVIDPGPDDPPHLAAIVEVLDGATPLAILLTHEHSDHAGCASGLAHLTGAPLRVGRGASPSRFAAADIDWIEEGEEIRTDAGTLRAVATPGHVPEHVSCLWYGDGAPAGGAAFVGDLMMGEGDTTLVATPEGDLRRYLASLDRIEELRASVLYPSHGPPITDPAAAVERYRAHRTERLAQVRAAVEREPSADTDRLVEIVYGAELEPALRSAAAGSVAAMLRYLRAE